MIGLGTYIALSIAYVLTMHLALAESREFQAFYNIALFIVGGIIGWAVGSYITGFVFAVVMHLVFWNKGEL